MPRNHPSSASPYGKPAGDIVRWVLDGELIAEDKEKALAWISTLGVRFPSRTPEVTVAPASNRTGRGHSIPEQLKAAVRKSLSINVPNDDVKLDRQHNVNKSSCQQSEEAEGNI
jgi:hypothetical protein